VIRRFPLGALVVAGLVFTCRPVTAQTRPGPNPIPGPRSRTSDPRSPTPDPRSPKEEPATPPVQVRASVDRTAIWVGDRITYSVDIVCARGVEILLDDLAKEKLRVNGLDVLSSDTTTTVDAAERTTYRLRYALTTYRVDVPSLSIQPMAARYYARRPGQRLQDIAPAGEVQVPGAVVAFRGTLPDQPTYELRDGRDLVPRNRILARTASIGLALVVISLAPAAFVAIAFLRRRTRKTGRRSARQARMDRRTTLERLRSLDVTTEDDRRKAYDEISAAVRQHLAAASGVPAPGLTAAEVDAALEGAGGRVAREPVTSLLMACDSARYGPPHALPSAQACREALQTAEQVLGGR
jgi:hypothetical protein